MSRLRYKAKMLNGQLYIGEFSDTLTVWYKYETMKFMEEFFGRPKNPPLESHRFGMVIDGILVWYNSKDPINKVQTIEPPY